MLDKRLADYIHDSSDAAEKNNINFTKGYAKFYLNLHCNADESYL